MKSNAYEGSPPAVPVQGVVVYPVQQQSVPVAPVVQQVQGQVVYPQGQPMMAYSQQQPVVYQASVMHQPLGPAAASAPSAPSAPPAYAPQYGYQQYAQPMIVQQPMVVQQPMMVQQQQPMVVQSGEQPQLLTLARTDVSKNGAFDSCMVGINGRMRKADMCGVWLAAMVFIMTVVIVFVPAWGTNFQRDQVSGGGIGTTQCYLETTLNIGLFQRDQFVYYYCDLAGTISNEIHENEIGMAMDCAYIHESNAEDDDVLANAACSDLHSAQAAGVVAFLCTTFQFLMIWLRFCNYRNVSVFSLIAVPVLSLVQLICVFVSVGSYTTVNDAVGVTIFTFQGTQFAQEVNMHEGGSWGTMIAVGVLTFFQLWVSLATVSLWRQDPQPATKQTNNCCCFAAACCAAGCCAGEQYCGCRGSGNGLCELFCCLLGVLIPR